MIPGRSHDILGLLGGSSRPSGSGGSCGSSKLGGSVGPGGLMGAVADCPAVFHSYSFFGFVIRGLRGLRGFISVRSRLD